MDISFNIQKIKHFASNNMFLFTRFLIILNILLIVLIVSLGVDVFNKIKESRYIGQEIESKNTIQVSATGEVYAQPDLALTTFSVVTEAKDVSQAMQENSAKMNSIIDFVKEQGIVDKDLKTTSFNIYPRYEWHEKGTCVIPCPSGRRVLVGYEVRQSLQVKIRDMTKIGEIVEGATEKGANQVSGLQFTIDNQDELKKQARAEAIEKARDKAKTLASQLGVKLIRITSFNEGSMMPRYYGLETAMGMGGDEGGGLQIETGENKIEVTVTITYEIN